MRRLAGACFGLLLAFTAQAQLIVPPFVVSSGHQQDPLVHDGFLDATLYGADPTGATDSTAAIQSAMNDARDYAMATYLPAGTYTVSDTLLGWEKLGDPSCTTTQNNYGPNMPNEPYVNQAAQAPSLIGPPSGARAVLELVNGASGFGDPSNPKPLVHMVNLYPDGGIAGYEGQNLPTSVGAFDCLFFAVVRDVDLTLGSGNAGAIGVQFYSAQMSYMENVNVDATGAYAGFQGTPATSDWVNLSVTGGQYGILMDSACGSNSLAGISLANQTTAGLSIAACGSTTVAGFDIQETSAQPITLGEAAGTPQSVSAAFFDGTIAGGGSLPAIANPKGMNLLLGNVFVQGPTTLIQSGSQAVPGSGNDLISAYAYTDSSTPGASWEPATSYELIDGVVGQQALSTIVAGPGAAPGDLLLRHLPGPLPWITDPGVVDATTLGADPTGFNDSTSAIQAAVNAGIEVFLPRGDYQISGTISLNPDTRLFGVPGMRTGLYGPDWSPNATYQPFIQSANSATGHTYLGDINFQLPDNVASSALGYDQSYLGAIDWQVGRSSVVNQIGVNMDYDQSNTSSAARDLIHVEGNGGGKWYGVQSSLIAGSARMQSPDFRFLLVDGTQAPLTLYGPNFEHADTSAFTEVSNSASNVRVLATKTECNDSWLWVENSSNVLVTSVSGDWKAGNPPGIGFWSDSSTNVELALLGWYANETDSTSYMVYQTSPAGPDAGISYADGVSVFEQGTFDETPFPHCGDGACDGAETSANCPVDCGTGSSGTSGGGSTGGGGTSGGSSGGTSGPTWTACRVASGSPDWANVPGLFIPYTDALILPDAPVAPTSNAQLSATVQTAWDSTNLYVHVQVTQPEVSDNPTVPVYYSDAVELYLDGTDSRASSYGAGDYQLIVTSGDRASPDGGFSHAATVGDGGYAVDFTVPFATLGSNSGALGFDIAVDDNPDGGATRASQLMWSGTGTAYEDPQQFGTLVLSESVCGASQGTSSSGSSGGTTGAASSASSQGGASSGGGSGAASSTTAAPSGTSSGGTSGVKAATGCGCNSAGDAPSLAWLALAVIAWLRRGRALSASSRSSPARACRTRTSTARSP